MNESHYIHEVKQTIIRNDAPPLLSRKNQKYIFDKLNVGDSLLIDLPVGISINTLHDRLRSSTNIVRRRFGYKFIITNFIDSIKVFRYE